MLGFISERPSGISYKFGNSPLQAVKDDGGGGCISTVVQKTSPNKPFHGKCDPFLQEHKQELPGPGWTDAEERAKKEMTETSLG